MRTGLESLRLSPDPSPSRLPIEPASKNFEETVAVEGQPFQIHLTYDQSGLRLTAILPDGAEPGQTLGTAMVSHEVVNTDILRIISIQKVGDSPIDPRFTLHRQLFEFAIKRQLRILPWVEHWNKMEPGTRRWLDTNQLADSYANPNI